MDSLLVCPPPMSSELGPDDLARYSRQLILPGFGADAQRALKKARVLVVGAGGLGCPAVQYLATAGIGALTLLTSGHITIVDNDCVERSNLARQVLHTDARIGMNKAASMAQAVSLLNPHTHVDAIQAPFTPANAYELCQAHDVVLDCTDRVMMRYLVSDAGVLADIPIVSGAAQGYDGQLVVLHRDLGEGRRGPCYRCLFPQSPRPEHTQSCDDGGVLGCVTGLIGTWQALETIQLLTGLGDRTPSMLFLSPLSRPSVRCVRVRGSQAQCRACGRAPDRITSLEQEDYETFCGLHHRELHVPSVDVDDVHRPDVLVVDVRPLHEYGITALPHSLHMAWDTIRRDVEGARTAIAQAARGRDVLVVCRRGNDSRAAVHLLDMPRCQNVRGGLRAYADKHPDFPMY